MATFNQQGQKVDVQINVQTKDDIKFILENSPYFKLIDSMIEVNKFFRKGEEFYYPHCSKEFIAREFHTVTCNIGRGVGKTSYILSRITPEDLLITADLNKRLEQLPKVLEARLPYNVEELLKTAYRLSELTPDQFDRLCKLCEIFAEKS